MDRNHGAATCRWATPTVDLPAPAWLEAADRPWSCLRDGTPHPLESTEGCNSCDRWEPRIEEAPPAPEPVSETVPCEHLRSGPFFLDILVNVDS